MNDDGAQTYFGFAYLVGIPAFLGSWWYAIDRWGWFIGLGLCWLPALCIGVIAGLAWPLILLAAVGLWLTGHVDAVQELLRP